MSEREALVIQTALKQKHAWKLHQQETDHHLCLQSFYDGYLSTSRTSEVYNLTRLLSWNQMLLVVLRYMNFRVSLLKLGLSQKLYWKSSVPINQGFY